MPQRSAAPANSIECAPLSILVAEDNVVSQRLVTALLRERGHAVTLAGNGLAEVLDLVEQRVFDLILMDIQMPEMDGLQATAEIRSREGQRGKHIPIVAMTAHAMAGDRERCLDAGMDGYIAKPIHPGELMALITGMMRAKDGGGLRTGGGMTVSNVPLAVQRARLLKEVPPFRPVAVQLLNLVSDISQPLARVVSLLRTDAVLTAEVLRLANSRCWGAGLKSRTSAGAGLPGHGAGELADRHHGHARPGRTGQSGNLARACWRHNLATAVICERLAPSMRISQERGYMSGLIHDIGRLALLRAFPNYEKP
jgi:CheY-like chemotaxis protein